MAEQPAPERRGRGTPRRPPRKAYGRVGDLPGRGDGRSGSGRSGQRDHRTLRRQARRPGLGTERVMTVSAPNTHRARHAARRPAGARSTRRRRHLLALGRLRRRPESGVAAARPAQHHRNLHDRGDQSPPRTATGPGSPRSRAAAQQPPAPPG
ncbi:hypothetical protein ACRAWF_03600 [Streptomyces sp. L7]